MQDRQDRRAETVSTIIQWVLGIGLTTITLGTALAAPDWSPFPADRRWVMVIFGIALGLILLEPAVWRKAAGKIGLPGWWGKVGLLVPSSYSCWRWGW